MIKYLYTILLAIGVFVLFHTCGLSEEEKEARRKKRVFVENPVQWDSLLLTSQIPFKNDSVDALYTINISYIYPREYQNELIKSNLHQVLNTIVWQQKEEQDELMLGDKTVDKVVNDYIDRQKELYTEQLNYQTPLWNGIAGDSLFSAIQNIETEILYNEANFVSYQVRVYNYRGKTTNATPNIEIINITLDLTDGRRLTLKDIFVDECEVKLNKLLLDKIFIDAGIEVIDDETISKYWGIYDIAGNDNFYLTSEGIYYTFNPQEYANLEVGVLTVFLPYDKVKAILKPESPLNIFLNSTETDK